MTKCWACEDTVPVSGAKIIRGKQENGHWVVKVVCGGCHKLIVAFPDTIEVIEGESWTLRPWVLMRGGV